MGSLVRLVDGALGDLAAARRAGARTARVGEVEALLLGLVEDVDIPRALDDRFGAFLREGDLREARITIISRAPSHIFDSLI